MGKIAKYLNQLMVGNVFDAPEVLEAYATDRSVLKIKPKLVAFPESTDDVRKILRFCYQLALKDVKIPIAVRGSGLDEMGADLSSGLVLSTEKMNQLLEADTKERLVRVQSGITLRELNTALSVNGLTIPVGGADNETIGGLISNCPHDDYSKKYGGILAYVERLEVVLPSGEILQSGHSLRQAAIKKAKEKTTELEICRKLLALAETHAELLETLRKSRVGMSGYPKIAQAISGSTINLLPLFFGAEGTLGVITEIILRAVPIKKETGRIVATFEQFETAKKFLEVAEGLKPKELNLYDMRIIKTAEEAGKKLTEVTRNLDRGYVIFAKFDARVGSVLKKVAALKKLLPPTTRLIIENSRTKPLLDEFENSLISFLSYAKSGERVPLLTDFYIPETNLAAFVQDLGVLEKSLGLDLAIFGSYAASNYHVRPKFNVSDPKFNKKAAMLLRTGSFVINRQNGILTGGGPEGRVKAMITNSVMGAEDKALYTKIKQIFDRYEIMNPEAKLGASSRVTLTHFRNTSSLKQEI